MSVKEPKIGMILLHRHRNWRAEITKIVRNIVTLKSLDDSNAGMSMLTLQYLAHSACSWEVAPQTQQEKELDHYMRRWDNTPPDIQRKIVYQLLDKNLYLQRENDRLQAIVKAADTLTTKAKGILAGAKLGDLFIRKDGAKVIYTEFDESSNKSCGDGIPHRLEETSYEAQCNGAVAWWYTDDGEVEAGGRRRELDIVEKIIK